MLGTTERRLKRRWAKQIFSGKGKALRVLSNEQAVIAYVGSSTNGLDYISEERVTSRVRVVARLPLP